MRQIHITRRQQACYTRAPQPTESAAAFAQAAHRSLERMKPAAQPVCASLFVIQSLGAIEQCRKPALAVSPGWRDIDNRSAFGATATLQDCHFVDNRARAYKSTNYSRAVPMSVALDPKPDSHRKLAPACRIPSSRVPRDWAVPVRRRPPLDARVHAAPPDSPTPGTFSRSAARAVPAGHPRLEGAGLPRGIASRAPAVQQTGTHPAFKPPACTASAHLAGPAAFRKPCTHPACKHS